MRILSHLLKTMASMSLVILGCICAAALVWGEGPDLSIIVANYRPPRIFNVDVASGKVNNVSIKNISGPVYVDFDPQTGNIYWIDDKLKQIRVTHILGKDDRILHSFMRTFFWGDLAVDTSNNKLFYTDTHRDVISVMDLNGNNSTDIVTGVTAPHGIVLHEEIRKLYWKDINGINTANYDGTSEREIVEYQETDIFVSLGLAFDEQNSTLYWCNNTAKRIESVKIDGTQRGVITSDFGCYDIFFSHGSLFFTSDRAIHYMPAGGGTVSKITSPHFTDLYGLHVYSKLNVSGCPSNTYGLRCVPCGHCAEDDVCNVLYGYCPNKCQPGYIGDRCDTECQDGTFGDECRDMCSSGCEGDTCDKTDGSCICKPGFVGKTCDKCQDGTFGDECRDMCSSGCEGDTCDKTDGSCICKPGFVGKTCDMKTEDGIGSKDHSLAVTVGAAGGGVASLLIVVVIVLAVLLRRKWNSGQHQERRDALPGSLQQSNTAAGQRPAVSTSADIRSAPAGYACLGEYGPFVAPPTYGRLGQNQQPQDQGAEGDYHLNPLKRKGDLVLKLEDDENDALYTVVE